MTSEQKRAHNEWKSQAILERKRRLLAQMSEDLGRTLKPLTVGVILSPDGKTGDVFAVPGFHLRLPWNKYAVDKHYLGTYRADGNMIYYNDNLSLDWEEDSHKGMPDQPNDGGSEVENRARSAALQEIESDFEQCYGRCMEAFR